MAHKKAGGSTQNGRDSNPKYLGVKITPGARAQVGSVLVRQRGTDVLPGKNVGIGRDHTIFALKEGIVSMTTKRKTHFNGKAMLKKVISVA